MEIIVGLTEQGKARATEQIRNLAKQEYTANLKPWLEWLRKEVQGETCDGHSISIEIPPHETKSGNPEHIRLIQSDFEFEIVPN